MSSGHYIKSMTITQLRIDAGVTPPHSVREPEKLAGLVESLKMSGWQGRPLLAVPNGDGWQLLTGSHRFAAARAAGLETIPALCIASDALGADGWDEIDSVVETGDDEDKLDVLTELGLDGAAEIMRAEVEANRTEDRRVA